MTLRPSITVALITYNHERYIASSIESILSQTCADFELVVVDDGSSDGTAQIIRGFTDPRIRTIRQENRGPSGARNTAIQAARGEWIAQMSGDDIAEPERLHAQLEYLEAHPDRLVFTRCVAIDDQGDQIPFDSPLNHPNWSREQTLRYLFLEGNCFLAPSAMAKASLFKSIGCYNPAFLQLQDYDLWIRLLLSGCEAHVIQRPLLRYRVRADGGNLTCATSEATNRSCLERRMVLRRFFEIPRVDTLAAIFPEIKELGFPLDDALGSFLLAMYVLRAEGCAPWLAAYAAEVLMELMSAADHRQVIQNQTGFTTAEFYRLVGGVNSLPTGEMEQALALLNAEREALLTSSSWRLTAPLRGLICGWRNLMNRP